MNFDLFGVAPQWKPKPMQSLRPSATTGAFSASNAAAAVGTLPIARLLLRDERYAHFAVERTLCLHLLNCSGEQAGVILMDETCYRADWEQAALREDVGVIGGPWSSDPEFEPGLQLKKQVLWMPEHAWNHDDILKRDSLSQKQCVVTGTVFRPHNFCIIEGSLEVKLPTVWTDEKQRWEESEKRRESQKQEDPGARKGRKVAKVAPDGRKAGSLKRRVRSHLARWEMKKCTQLWREAHFEVNSVKNWRSQTSFGSWDVERSARRCGAKYMSKSNVQSTTTTTTLHCTILHYTTLHYNSTTLHYTTLFTLHYTTAHYTTLHYTKFNYNWIYNCNCNDNYITRHYTTPHYTPLHPTTLHSTTLHSTTLDYTTLTTTTLQL